MIDKEDEVDWSDGTLNSPFPLFSASRLPTPVPHGSEPDHEATEADPDADSLGLPLYLENIISGQSTTSAAAPKIKPNITISASKPTNVSCEDLSRFALYQANQKTYEAMFLKSFVTHALHPTTLNIENIRGGNEDMIANLKDYLRSVAENVDQLTDKMIWNAHSKCINFLAATGYTIFPFLDVDRFEQDLSAFGPDHACAVTDEMRQSWHLTNSRLNMVQYSAKDYLIEPKNSEGRSPFVEIEQAVRALAFNKENIANAKGRVLHYPSGNNECSAQQDNSRKFQTKCAAALQSDDRRINSKAGQTENDNVKEPESSRNLSKDVAAWGALVPSNKRAAQITASEVLRKAKQVFPEREISHLEAYVARSDPASSVTRAPPKSNLRPHWTKRIRNIQKRRLAKMRIGQRESKRLPADIKSVIARAVAKNILKAPLPHMQSRIDALALQARRQQRTARSRAPAKVQKSRYSSATVPKEAEPVDSVHEPCNTQDNGTYRKRRNRQASGSRKKKPCTEPDMSTAAEHQPTTLASTANRPRFAGSEAIAGGEEVAENTDDESLPPHPSGSTTLEPHQVLPPGAYFDKKNENEKPAWRCGVKHALGHYYIAGDRRSCPGCNTNIERATRTKGMDFYLPSRQYFAQPVPGVVWEPSHIRKPRSIKSSLSHNSIGKDAYWEAIDSGYDAEYAQQVAVAAINDYLNRKSRVQEAEPPNEPIVDEEPELVTEPMQLEPESEPAEPEPHPSGSTTMEHGQDIPECHYFSKKERHEEFAWRCDGNHALGRYYMAGDKRTCPGCGLNKDGLGRRKEMDFYMPSQTAIRQEAPGLVAWVPRKPYKSHKKQVAAPAKKTAKKSNAGKSQSKSHNQICAANYWRHVESGLEHEEALQRAINETVDHLDALYADDESDASGTDAANADEEGEVDEENEADQDVEVDEGTEAGEGGEVTEGQGGKTIVPVSDDSSEDDDPPSSGSDSE